jgi:hypothetical protein
MSEIKITTSGELKLNDDVVGRIEWLRPFVESDVAGEFSLDDPFVDEWGVRIDCTACVEKDELLDDLDGAVDRARRLLSDARKKLKSLNLSDGATAQRLVEVDVLLGNLEFEV